MCSVLGIIDIFKCYVRGCEQKTRNLYDFIETLHRRPAKDNQKEA
jgi:hypothetical protein